VKWESVRPYVCRSIVAEKFAEIFDQASRAVDCALLALPVSPGAFLTWAKNEELEVPADLEKFVRERGQSISDWRSRVSHLETQLAETSAKLSEKKKLSESIESGRDDGYSPPYLVYMQRSAAELHLDGRRRISKKTICNYLKENWPPELGPPTQAKLTKMATFLGNPEHEKGGVFPANYRGPRAKR
jgi:hypothetical protein